MHEMATDGPDPKPCDPVIYSKGNLAAIVAGVPSNAMERWVRRVAIKARQPVDWHFVGGRAFVKTLGTVGVVHTAIDDLRHELPADAKVTAVI
jgi:hypothetical protein